MICTIQDPAKYQKDAKYDHGFLAFQVCDWLPPQPEAGNSKTRLPVMGDLAVHLLPGVCSVCLFCFLSGQSQCK